LLYDSYAGSRSQLEKVSFASAIVIVRLVA
jgi:hypothetical protein